MNTKQLLIAALLAGAFAPASARNAEPMPLAPFDGADGAPMHAFDHRFFAGRHGKPVKNAPYSAELISELQQNLADGNQIVSKRSTMSYRDSAGRTRQEVRDSAGALRSVTINDPAEGATFILNPEAKTATRIAGRGGKMGKMGTMGTMGKMQAEGDERFIVKRVERHAEGEARGRVGEHVRIRVARGPGEGREMADIERIGPMLAGAFGDMKWASKATVKDLGTREFDGIKAQGKLKSYEIPAGDIGNRNPIMVAAESWYAPDLQVTLLSKRSDPRSGERSWRMAGIKRDEPAAALFAVPSDYTVKDMTMETRKLEKK